MTLQRPSRPLVVAHRGDSRNFPENTLSSIRGAIVLGADVVELDVHRSADDVAVILHDRDLKRTTGRAGRVDALTAAEICVLDAESWFGGAHRGDRVPSLAQVVDAIGESDIGLCLEFKDGDYHTPDHAARWLVEQVTRFELRRRAIVNLRSPEIAACVQRLDPGIRIALDCDPRSWPPGSGPHVADLAASGTRLIEVEHQAVTNDLMRACHQAGISVWAWTANDPADWDRLCAAGVDAILTDDPGALIRHLGARDRRL